MTGYYHQWEKEAYAVVRALKQFRAYLLGSQFIVYTDHKPLTSLFIQDLDNTLIQRWAVLLQEYGAVIKYCPGANNVCADMLSRITEPTQIAILDAEDYLVLGPTEGIDPASLPLLADNLSPIEVMSSQRREFTALFEDFGGEESRYVTIEGYCIVWQGPDLMTQSTLG